MDEVEALRQVSLGVGQMTHFGIAGSLVQPFPMGIADLFHFT